MATLGDALAALDPAGFYDPAADAAALEAAARKLEAGFSQAKEALSAGAAAAVAPEEAVAFLTYMLRRVLPAGVGMEGLGITERVEAFLVDSGCPAWCALLALSEALVPGEEAGEEQQVQASRPPPSLRESPEALAFVVRRLEEECFGGNEGRLRAVVRELVSSDAAPVNRVLQALALLPMRASNALRGPAPASLAAPNIFEAVARAALRLYMDDDGAKKGDGWGAFWGPFVHKAAKMGQADPVARAWVEEAAAVVPDAISLAPLVECIPLPALEPFLVAVTRAVLAHAPTQEQQQRALACGFGDVITTPSVQAQALRSLLVSKLLITGGGTGGTGAKRLLPRQAAPLLVRLAASIPDGSSVGGGLSGVLLAVGRAWKERRFIQAADVAQQAFVTQALVSGLGMLVGEGPKALEAQPSLVPALLEGVGAHLESPIEPIRVQGMLVGEAFAGVMGQPLRFDELDGKREGEGGVTVEKKEAGPAAAAEASKDEEDGDEEEEEELQPYDLSDDEADLLPVAPPKYLRRIVEYLRVKEEDGACDKHTAALREAEGLIRARPADLPDLCGVLARELLTLENRFALEEFAPLRRGALVALISTSPERVAPLLAALAFDPQISLGMRLEVLDLLMEGAQDLSQLKPTHALMGQTTNSNSSLLVADVGPRVQGKRGLVKETVPKEAASGGALSISAGKTRRWGYRRGRAPQPMRNLFGPVAARAFFRPLVHGLWRHSSSSSSSSSSSNNNNDNDKGKDTAAPTSAPHLTAGGLLLLPQTDDEAPRRLWARDNDQALAMAKTILALACFVECSGHAPGTAPMAEELLSLAWPLRESPFPELRRAVLLALAAAVAHVQVEPFLARGGEEAAKALQAVAAWTAAVRELDADAENRRLAGAVVASQPRELAALGLYALLQDVS